MSFRGIRQALRAQPRWMLAVLLAFAIETLPPPSALVSHRHAAGDVVHSHAGPVARTAVDDGGATRSVGHGIAHAPPRDLHQHVAHPVVAIRGPAVPAPDPAFLVTALFVATSPATVAAALHPGQARAPPSFDA